MKGDRGELLPLAATCPARYGIPQPRCAQTRSVGPESGPQDEPGRMEGAIEALGLEGLIVIICS